MINKYMSDRQKSLMQRLYRTDVWQGFTPTHFDAVQGWNGNHPSLAKLAGANDAKTVIDVGVWKGQSTINMARAMKNAGMDGVVIAVDTFLGSPEHWEGQHALYERRHGMPNLYETFLSNVIHAGLTEYVIPLPQTSTTAVTILRRAGVLAQVIHVDAAHEYREVINDAQDYWAILAPGGYLVGDDYGPSWPGVVQAAHEFAALKGLELTIDGPKWWVRKPL